jgi:hypothetical protein
VSGLVVAAGCGGGSNAATVTVTQTTTASTGVNATPPPSSGPTTNASGLVLEQTVNEGIGAHYPVATGLETVFRFEATDG